MRILFVTGTSTGGAARSTDELARRLQGRGHEVAGLFGWQPRPRRWQMDGPRRGQMDGRDGARVGRGLSRRVDRAAHVVRASMPPRPQAVPGRAYPVWRDRVPERSLPMTCRQWSPDVVVVSAVSSSAWRTMRPHLAGSHTPCVLYLRTQGAVHRLRDATLPDLVVANAWSFLDGARALGAEPVMIPSVVEADACVVASTRRRVLFVNPVRRHGLSTVLDVARQRPEIPFTVHESAPLHRRDRSTLRAAVRAIPNVELRRGVTDPRDLYRDARLLLAPYELSNRPRVVLEAHHNGLPVVARDLSALRECVGPGGILVPPTAPPAAWAAAVGELWDRPERYRSYATAALRHSQRDEVDPATIVDRFEAALAGLVAHARR